MEPTALQLADACLSRLQVDGEHDISSEELQSIKNRLLSSIRIINGTFNLRSAINRLHPEILYHIFQYVPAIRVRLSVSVWTCDSIMATDELIPLTQVCHRWREIALAHSLLWTGISDDSNAASIFLKRSGNSPLKLYLKRPDSRFSDELLAQHGPRVRELFVKPSPTSSWRSANISSILDFPAPQLEDLSISFDRIFVSSSQGFAPDVAFPTIFRGVTPKLRFLALHYVQWLPSNQFASLTHLSLAFKLPNGETNPWLILDLLRRCPALQDLVLREVSFDWSIRPRAASDSSVTLFHLRSLTLGKMEVEQMGWLLSQITTSPETVIILFNLAPRNLWRLDLLRPARTGPADILTKAHITLSRGTLCLAAAGSCSGVRIECEVPFLFHSLVVPSTDSRIFSWWLHIVPTADITELWVTMIPPINSGILRTLLEVYPSLKTLVLFPNPNDREPFNVLHGRSTSSDDGVNTLRVLCPNLTTLRLCLGACPLSRNLDVILTNRAIYGHPVQRLIVEYEPDSGLQQPLLTRTILGVEEVEFRAVERFPEMEVPETCRRKVHCHWPGRW